MKLIFHLPLKIFYPVLKEGDSSLKESKIEQNKWENKSFCSDMFAISHCALILVNSNRESCNVRLTAATHTRTYTINNTHTSSTDSKHNILQFDLAKKGKKNHHFFITMKEEACNCFTFRKKHVYLNSDFTSIYHQKVTKDKILAWIKDT